MFLKEKDLKKILFSLPAKLLFGIVVGIAIGLFIPEAGMVVLVPIKNILNQVISFVVPLIVIGFIAPSITKLGGSASKMLGIALALAYVSSVLAAFTSMGAGYAIIPNLSFGQPSDLKELPADIFGLEIPQIMPVMSALAFAVMIGLAAVWTKAKVVTNLLQEFQEIVLQLVEKIVIPILPVYIALTFCGLAYAE